MLVDKIKALIDKYDLVKTKGQIKSYDEANTCKDFILPLFEALGWDIYNREEVTAQASASRGRVDYAFCIKSIPKFFLEAKSLKVDLNDTRWAEQTINYAWHKGVVWAVLTDFEAIKVFNAEWITKNPNESLFFETRYDKYLENFDQLSLLSKQAFLENRLDKEAEKWGKKRRKIPVDEKLLSDILKWRNLLANSLRKNHPALLEEELDESIQRILDRLIFIRTCEDRNIEPITLSPLLREWLDSGKKRRLSQELKSVFRNFDEGYNSQIFSSHLCEDLKIDPAPISFSPKRRIQKVPFIHPFPHYRCGVNSEVLEIIINGLYETEDRSIRYDFSAIDADVLGSMYEQYLGHILKKTPTRTTVTEKHLRRKEMGIYYTPKYIVDYIVKNTVGEMLKEKSYKDAMKLKILDPACGSGSFLIRAFEEMDNYLKEKRSQKGEEFAYFRRMEILNNNLYGVDLDKQAVEIAQLNLLLKALETRQKLPVIKNIRQGNSLISGDELMMFKYFGKNWKEKHPFNWQEEYSEVFKDGGFDVVIGNPPYVNIKEITGDEKEFYRHQFKYAIEQFDLYILFMEKAFSLLKSGGYFSFIIPDAILSRSNVTEIRKYFLTNTSIKSLIQVSGVFADPSVASVIIVYQKKKPSMTYFTSFIKSDNLDALTNGNYKEIKTTPSIWLNFPDSRIAFMENNQMNIINKISPDKDKVTLEKLVLLVRGEELGKGSEKIKVAALKLSRPFLVGENIERYQTKFSELYIKESEIEKPKENYFVPKIMVRQLGTNINATLDEKGKYVTIQSIYSVINNSKYDLKYLFGLLNSSLINFYYRLLFGTKQLFPRILIENLKVLPIYKIDFSNPKEKKMHDDLVKLVDKMLDLNKQIQKTSEKSDKWYSLKSEIEKTDKKIDEVVYKLYGITEKEKKIIEK